MNLSEIDGNKDDIAAFYFANAFNFLGPVGGFVSNTIQFYMAREQNQKMVMLLKQLAVELENCKLQINNEFIKSDDFEDMVEDILFKVSKTHQTEKIKAFKSIFKNAVFLENPVYEDIEEISTLIDKWQASHIRLLSILSDPNGENQKLSLQVSVNNDISPGFEPVLSYFFPDWDYKKIERVWKKLVDDNIINTPSIRGVMQKRGIGVLENRLTDFGIIVASFLKDPN